MSVCLCVHVWSIWISIFLQASNKSVQHCTSQYKGSPTFQGRSMSLHAVPWACMEFHRLVCSTFLCLSSSQKFRSVCYKVSWIPAKSFWDLVVIRQYFTELWYFLPCCTPLAYKMRIVNTENWQSLKWIFIVIFSVFLALKESS